MFPNLVDNYYQQKKKKKDTEIKLEDNIMREQKAYNAAHALLCISK
jgi:hypothetical protein